NAMPAANIGRALQSESAKSLIAFALSPSCHAVRIGCVTGPDREAAGRAGTGEASIALSADAVSVGAFVGVAEPLSELPLPQPARKIETVISPVRIGIFIKGNTVQQGTPTFYTANPSGHK